MPLPVHKQPLSSVIRKVVTLQNEVFCILQFRKTNCHASCISTAFWHWSANVKEHSPLVLTIWGKRVLMSKSTGQPHTSEENVRRNLYQTWPENWVWNNYFRHGLLSFWLKRFSTVNWESSFMNLTSSRWKVVHEGMHMCIAFNISQMFLQEMVLLGISVWLWQQHQPL